MILAIDLGFLSTINYIFYIILGLAVLAGFLRGFKKTLFAFIMMAIFYIVFFLTINSVVNMLWSMDMSWLGGVLGDIDSSLSGFTSFETDLNLIIQMVAGDNIDLATSSAEVIALATGLGQFVLKLVWTIVYFTVVLVIWKLLSWIIGAIFLKTKKAATKNRGLGAAFGVLNGAMAVFVMMVVMGGFMSVAESALVLISDSSDPIPTLSLDFRYDQLESNYTAIPLADTSDIDAYVEDLQGMVDEYNNNIFVKLVSGITIESSINSGVEVPLHLDLFDQVLSFNYGENVVGIRLELQVFSEAAAVFIDSDFSSSQDITDVTGDEIRDIFAILSHSNLIVALMPVAIEVAAEQFGQTLPISTTELYEIDFEDELTNLGFIAGALFDILNGAGFIGGEGSVDQITIDGDAVRDIFENISDSDVILLMTETLLLPMLEDPEGSFSQIITVPDDFDIEAEYLALGEIFAEIIDADIAFADLENADVSVLLSAASQVDLNILLDSKLITEALISIFSGQTEVGGLDILTVPAGIVWRDTYTLTGDVDVPGELRNILSALNAVTDLADELDFENLDINALLDMEDSTIETFFGSYVIRATVSDIISETALGDIPLVMPDSVYDGLGYFTETELINVVKAIKLIVTGTSGEFDILEALNLSSTEIDTLLASNIVYATIGKEIYSLGTSSLVVPGSTTTTVEVDSADVDVIIRTEIKSIFQALAVLNITDLDSMSFDAGILDNLENSTEDDLDDTKISTLLGSDIIHATVSDMILDLDESEGGILLIADTDISGNDVLLEDLINSIDLISEVEIGNLLKALYGIGITNFDNIDLEDSTIITDNIGVLLNSAIIHATISDIVFDLDTILTIPEKDLEDNNIIVIPDTTRFISNQELTDLFAALDMLGFTDPNGFSTNFDFTLLETTANQDILLDSAIMHATVSDRIFNLGAGTLIVPLTDETGLIDIRLEPVTIGPTTEFILNSELKALFDAMNTMGFTDFNNVSSGVSSSTLIDNSDLISTSSILQATVSDQILNNALGNIIIPDEDQLAEDIRIVQSDVTYISNAELTKFFASIELLSISDFDTFDVSPLDIFTIDLDTFLTSDIMNATISKYVLDQSGYEDDAYGTSILLVSSTSREDIDINLVPAEQINKQELIYIIQALDLLDMDNFDDNMAPADITDLPEADMNTILNSASFHITIDNMLRVNVDINSDIPALAELAANNVDPLTIKSELVAFVIAVNTIGAADFTNTNIQLSDFSSLDATQRSTVLNSMIIRNKLTPDLEVLVDADPFYSFDPIADYENDPVTPFLTKQASIDVIANYYPVI